MTNSTIRKFQNAVQLVARECDADSDRNEIIAIAINFGFGRRVGEQIADELGRKQ